MTLGAEPKWQAKLSSRIPFPDIQGQLEEITFHSSSISGWA